MQDIQHRVFLNKKGFIEIVIIGPLSASDVVTLGERTLQLVTLQQDKGLPIKALLDSTQAAPEMAKEAIAMATIIFKDIDYEKVAGLGDSVSHHRQEKIQTDAGKSDRFRFFLTRKDAEDWLTE